MPELGVDTAEDLDLLDIRLKQLKLEFEFYFMGNRKYPPRLLQNEVQRIVGFYANFSIRNTGLRFRFNALRARHSSFKRHWESTLRKIETGTYRGHQVKANLRDRQRAEADRRRGIRPGARKAGR
jgi:hypothetical protein